MNRPLNLRQRRLLRSTEFKFLPGRLDYTYSGLRFSRRSLLDYTEIAPAPIRHVARYSAYLNVGLIVAGVGLILGLYVFLSENRFTGFAWLVPGAMLLVAYVTRKRKYYELKTNADPIIVLGGDDGKDILSNIAEFRKARFLDLLRTNEYCSDKAKRERLIEQLTQEGTISGAEGVALAEPA